MHEIASVAVEILEIYDETPSVKTITFSTSFDIRPGQFCMVWVPGVDEVPMGFSSANSISVQQVGEATTALCALSPGEKIGIRGPLGNGFSPKGRVLAIAGGVGAAPLLPLAENGDVDTFILGARTQAELPFLKRLDACTDLRIATDDGTTGYHGFVTGVLADLNPAEYDTICVCGPEMMMKNVLRDLVTAGCAEKAQLSLVRYMKCGVGICGSCSMDPDGLCVCREGPVIPGDRLLSEKSEFGRYARDASGRHSDGPGH